MAIAAYLQTWRYRLETAFNAALPGIAAEWNGNPDLIPGWHDLPVVQESEGLQPKSTIIYPSTAAGQPFMNTALPVAGSFPTDLGSLEMATYLELIDPLLIHIFGQVTRVDTPGVAAAATVVFGSLATLDTQPVGTEQLIFTIDSATATSGAEINIIQNAITVETIVILDSVAPQDPFVVYSKGGYDGSVNAITFSIAGTVTGGNVVVTGSQYTTSTYSFPTDPTSVPPTLVIEEVGRPEAGVGAGKGAEFYPGCIIPTLDWAFDASANDNLLMSSLTVLGVNPSLADPVPYVNDAAKYYRPIVGWNGVFKIDVGAGLVNFCEVVTGTFSLNSNNEMVQEECSTQNPTGFVRGLFESMGSFTFLPSDDSRWLDYRAAQERPAQMLFQSQQFIHGSTPWSLQIDMSSWTIEDYSRNKQSAAMGVEMTYRSVANDTDGGPIKVVVVSRKPA